MNLLALADDNGVINITLDTADATFTDPAKESGTPDNVTEVTISTNDIPTTSPDDKDEFGPIVLQADNGTIVSSEEDSFGPVIIQSTEVSETDEFGPVILTQTSDSTTGSSQVTTLDPYNTGVWVSRTDMKGTTNLHYHYSRTTAGDDPTLMRESTAIDLGHELATTSRKTKRSYDASKKIAEELRFDIYPETDTVQVQSERSQSSNAVTPTSSKTTSASSTTSSNTQTAILPKTGDASSILPLVGSALAGTGLVISRKNVKNKIPDGILFFFDNGINQGFDLTWLQTCPTV